MYKLVWIAVFAAASIWAEPSVAADFGGAVSHYQAFASFVGGPVVLIRGGGGGVTRGSAGSGAKGSAGGASMASGAGSSGAPMGSGSGAAMSSGGGAAMGSGSGAAMGSGSGAAMGSGGGSGMASSIAGKSQTCKTSLASSLWPFGRAHCEKADAPVRTGTEAKR